METNGRTDGRMIGEGGDYNRRRATWYIRFFPRINCHRRGFFVIKMILYLETRTICMRGRIIEREREREGRGEKYNQTYFVDCLGSRSFIKLGLPRRTRSHLEIVLIIIPFLPSSHFIWGTTFRREKEKVFHRSNWIRSFVEWLPLLIQPRGIVVKHEIYVEGIYFSFRPSDRLDYRERFTYSLS